MGSELDNSELRVLSAEQSELDMLKGVSEQIVRATLTGLTDKISILPSYSAALAGRIDQLTEGELGLSVEERDKKAASNVNVIAAVKQEEVEKFQAEMSKIASDGRIEGVGEYKKLGAMLGNDSYWEYLKNNEEEMKKVGNAIAKPIVQEVVAERRAEIYEEEIKKAELQVKQELTEQITVEENAAVREEGLQQGLQGVQLEAHVEQSRVAVQERVDQRVAVEAPVVIETKAPVLAKQKTEERLQEEKEDGTLEGICIDKCKIQLRETGASEEAVERAETPLKMVLDEQLGVELKNKSDAFVNVDVAALETSLEPLGQEDVVERVEEMQQANSNEEQLVNKESVAASLPQAQEAAIKKSLVAEKELVDKVNEVAAENEITSFEDGHVEQDSLENGEDVDVFASMISDASIAQLQESGMAEVSDESVSATQNQNPEVAAVEAVEAIKDADIKTDEVAPKPTETLMADAKSISNDATQGRG